MIYSIDRLYTETIFMFLLIRRILAAVWPLYKDTVYVPGNTNQSIIKTIVMLVSLIVGISTAWYLTTHSVHPPLLTNEYHIEDWELLPSSPAGEPPCKSPGVCQLYETIYQLQETSP